MKYLKLVGKIFFLILILIVSLFIYVDVSHEPSDDDFRRRAAGIDLVSIETALNAYYKDNGFYPTEEQGLMALVRKPESKPIPQSYNENSYIRMEPIDPWNEPYKYAALDDRRIVWSDGSNRYGGVLSRWILIPINNSTLK